MHQTWLIRTVAVGALPFLLQAQILAINRPGAIVDECVVSLELAGELDSSTYNNGLQLPTGTVLDDIFKTDRFLQNCRDYPSISYISIRFQPIAHGRKAYLTQGFLVSILFQDEKTHKTASLMFQAESGLEPPRNNNGDPLDKAPFVETDTWWPPVKIGDGSGS